jgi:hypothetical protein
MRANKYITVIDQALVAVTPTQAQNGFHVMEAKHTPIDHLEIEADGVIVELGGTLAPKLTEIH